jgi:hypothetical protein
VTLKAQLESIREAPHYVYRCYDASGLLLYVGCSMKPEERLKQHSFVYTWWTDRIARVDLEGFPDQAAGLAAEKRAIQSEHPFYNRQFRSTESQRADWRPEHYVNWLTAYLEDPSTHRTSPVVRREVKRAADDYSRRFGRNLRKDVGRVRVGYRRSAEIAEAKWGPDLHPVPKWRVA